MRTCSVEKFQHDCSTCWTLAWFWSRIWSRAAERAGLANSGIAGAAPRRPGHELNIRIHSSRISPHPSKIFSEFLPCLFPCTIGLSNIFRAAGLLRPVSICMTVGSGRRPFPRLTALKGSTRQTWAQVSGRHKRTKGETHQCATIPLFGQQWGRPTCFFQEHQEHRRIRGCWSHPAACRQRLAVPPQPSRLWQTPTPRTAENFHLDPEPTAKKSTSRLLTFQYQHSEIWQDSSFVTITLALFFLQKHRVPKCLGKTRADERFQQCWGLLSLKYYEYPT